MAQQQDDVTQFPCTKSPESVLDNADLLVLAALVRYPRRGIMYTSCP